MQEERDFERSFDKNGRELLKKAGDFNTLKFSSSYMERSSELLDKVRSIFFICSLILC